MEYITKSSKGKVMAIVSGIAIGFISTSDSQIPKPQSNQNPDEYTVAVYYWPNFHRDSYHQSKKGEGWTEWEIVLNGNPKFEGHYQPKVPLWGYRDESDPKEMARSIDAMANAGIGAIIFDWYRYDDEINGGIMIEDALQKGFLKAPNRDRINFALMWANHTYIDCHPFAPGDNFSNAPVWRKGEVGRAAFELHTQDAIQDYFSLDNYWKIDGAPYFSVYHLDKLIDGLGNVATTRAALDDFRERVKEAGFPDLHLNIIDQGLGLPQVLQKVKGQPWPGDPSKTIETISDLMNALGANSSTMYTWVHNLWPMLMNQTGRPASDSKTFGFADDPSAELKSDRLTKEKNDDIEKMTLLERAGLHGVIAVDYSDYGRKAMSILDERASELGVTYFPHVSMGWDGTPRNYSMGIVLNNTPDKWEDFLSQTKKWLKTHPESRGVVTLNSWNEWVEGSYIEPDSVYGMSYLEAIKNVFGQK